MFSTKYRYKILEITKYDFKQSQQCLYTDKDKSAFVCLFGLLKDEKLEVLQIGINATMYNCKAVTAGIWAEIINWV